MAPPMPEVEGVEHRYAQVNGFRMHYAEAGSGEPLVLLHGWPQHWWMWRDLIGPLSERYRLIVPDLRGHGWSEKPPGRYRKATLARDVIAMLDRLGLDRVRLAGHDWGAFASLLLATMAPERVERMVAMSVPHPWQRKPDPVAAAATVYQWVLGGPWGRFAIQHGFMRAMLRGGRSIGSFSPGEIEMYEAVQREPDAVNASVHMYRTFQAFEVLPWLRGTFVPARLTTPTLWLVGEHDILARNSDDGYRDHADDMTLEVVDGANHFMPEELPQQTAERMLQFLA